MAERTLSEQDLYEALNYLGEPVRVPLRGGLGLAEAPPGLPALPATAEGLSGPIETPGQDIAPPPPDALGDLGSPGAGPSLLGLGPSFPDLGPDISLPDLGLSPDFDIGAALNFLSGGGDAGGGGQGGQSEGVLAEPERSGLQQAQELLGALQKVGKTLSDLFPGSAAPSHSMPPDTRAEFEQQRAGERGDFTAIPETPGGGGPQDFTNMQQFGEFGEITPQATPNFTNMNLFGEFGEIPGPDFTNMQQFGEFGELGPAAGALPVSIAGDAASRIPGVLNNLPETMAAVNLASQYLGPIAGGTSSLIQAINANNDFDRAMNLVNMALYTMTPFTMGSTAVIAAALEAIDAIVSGATGSTVSQHLGFAPSNEWLRFAPRLADIVRVTNNSLSDVANNIMLAQTPEELAAAAQGYRDKIASFAGGFNQGPVNSLETALPTPPGATGTEHEGGIRVDYGEIMPYLRNLIGTRYALMTQPSPEAFAAHRAAVEGLQPAFQRFEDAWWPRVPPDVEGDRQRQEQIVQNALGYIEPGGGP